MAFKKGFICQLYFSAYSRLVPSLVVGDKPRLPTSKAFYIKKWEAEWILNKVGAEKLFNQKCPEKMEKGGITSEKDTRVPPLILG